MTKYIISLDMYDHDMLVYFGDVLDVAGSLSEYLSKDEIIAYAYLISYLTERILTSIPSSTHN